MKDDRVLKRCATLTTFAMDRPSAFAMEPAENAIRRKRDLGYLAAGCAWGEWLRRLREGRTTARVVQDSVPRQCCRVKRLHPYRVLKLDLHRSRIAKGQRSARLGFLCGHGQHRSLSGGAFRKHQPL